MSSEDKTDKGSGYLWKNPLSVWGAKGGNYEVPSIPVPDPREVWRKNASYKVRLYKVGRFKYYHKWANHGARLWKRWRWWPTRRTLLYIRGLYKRCFFHLLISFIQPAMKHDLY